LGVLVKYAVIGSRDFDDYNLLKFELDKYDIREIVSGGANGADSLAENYAKEMNIPTTIFKPDWKTYGKAAGVIRNAKIVEYSDIVIAFWNGSSKGTENSIKHAEKNHKRTIIIRYSKDK
jgi:hypothetical protein